MAVLSNGPLGEGQYVDESNLFLRRLLFQRGSYPIIAAAASFISR